MGLRPSEFLDSQNEYMRFAANWNAACIKAYRDYAIEKKYDRIKQKNSIHSVGKENNHEISSYS